MNFSGSYHYLGRKRAGRPKKQSVFIGERLFLPPKIFSKISCGKRREIVSPSPLMLLKAAEMISAAHYNVATQFLGLHRRVQCLLGAPAHKRSSPVARLGMAQLGTARLNTMTEDMLLIKEQQDFALWRQCHAALHQCPKMGRIVRVIVIVIDENDDVVRSMLDGGACGDLGFLRKGLSVLCDVYENQEHP